MQPHLTFLHTAQAHVATFDRLMGELAPDVPVRHLVDESLLADAMADDEITPALAERIAAALAADGPVIVCTCSTIGGVAVDVGQRQGRATVMRIDQAMAEATMLLASAFSAGSTALSTVDPDIALIILRLKRRHPGFSDASYRDAINFGCFLAR